MHLAVKAGAFTFLEKNNPIQKYLFMTRQKLLSFALILGVFIINSGAGCSSKADDPQPDNFQSLLGKWQLQGFTYNITKQDGSTKIDKVDAKARGIIVFYEFFSDGRLVLTQDGKTLNGRWSLNVNQLDGKDIQDGKLTISGADEWREVAQSLGQSGDLTYEVGTATYANNPVVMNLSIDVTSTGPYKKNVLIYTFEKR